MDIDENGNEAAYVWTVTIELPAWLVADGANLTERKVRDMLERFYSYVKASELHVDIVSAPDDEDIARAQGYASAAAMRARE